MYITIWLLTLAFISISSFIQADGNANPCTPPRTVSLNVGHEGIIECICDDSISLYWYFGNDTTAVNPFIYIDNSVKYGPGFSSGQYDINVNGSLVIKNVSSTDGGAYAVRIIEPGNPEPRVEMFTVHVNGPEETDVTTTSNYGEERKTADAKNVTTITMDEPGKILTSPVNENGEQFLQDEPGKILTSPVNENEMVDIETFQDEIDELKKLVRATLALLVIVLLGIGLVVWRSYTAKSAKNPNCDEEKAQCHQQLKQLLASCHGSCLCGHRNESTDS